MASFTRLSLQAQTTYAELLDRLLREAAGTTPGSIVRKTISERVYVYAQHRTPGGMRQTYLGPESDDVLARVERIEAAWRGARDRSRERDELIAMLRASRVPAPTAPEAKVLGALADAGLFRVGAVLAGTHAFAALGNALGVRWDAVSLRTGEIDVVHDPHIAVALHGDVPSTDFARLTSDAASGVHLWPIPGFDPREPSTSFKVHGAALHVDLLTPLRGRARGPVAIPVLEAAAFPLRFLDYLVEESMPAAVVGGAGILVSVPTPARFALHKLIVAQERSAALATKASKDLAQAEALLSLLLEDRPGDVRVAWRALTARGPSWVKRAKASLARIDAAIGDALLG